jgi:hypothetical protein
MVREPELLLLRFMTQAVIKESVGMPEICVYAVLFQLWMKSGCENPIQFSRSKVMRLSKVKSKTTYHKCISVLMTHGFIKYQPSYHPAGSLAYLIDIL